MGVLDIMICIIGILMVMELICGVLNSISKANIIRDSSPSIKDYTNLLIKLRIKVEIFDNGFTANKFNFSKELKEKDEYRDLSDTIIGLVEVLKVIEEYVDNAGGFSFLLYDLYAVDGLGDRDLESIMGVIDDIGFKLLFSEDEEVSTEIMVECNDYLDRLYSRITSVCREEVIPCHSSTRG